MYKRVSVDEVYEKARLPRIRTDDRNRRRRHRGRRERTPRGDYAVGRRSGLHGGHNLLAFDYRVIGSVDGEAGARMTLRDARDLAGPAVPHVRAIVVTRAAIPRTVSLAEKRHAAKPFVAPPGRVPDLCGSPKDDARRAS